MPGFIHRSRLVKKTAVLCTMFSASAIFFSGCGGYGAEPPQCMTSVSDLADEQALRQENEKVFIPETYEDHIALAAGYLVKQNPETALACYERAIELERDREEAYQGAADAYLQMDDVSGALAILDEGIAECGTDALLWRKEYVWAGVAAVRTKIVQNEYDEDGNILHGREIERDRNGNEIRTAEYGAGGNLCRTVESQYDEDGRQSECQSISYDEDGNGECIYHWKCAYDENGNKTEEISYDEEGSIRKRTAYAYDVYGEQAQVIVFDKNGKVTEKTETETEYDAQGNKICSTVYRSNSMGKSSDVIEYDGQGNEIKITYYDASGEITGKIEEEYDKDGNWTGLVRWDETGKIALKWESEYDGHSEPVSYVHYDGMQVDYRYEREYDENGNEVRFAAYDREDDLISIHEYTYDENGLEVKRIITTYIKDEVDEANKTIVFGYDRTYDEAGRVTLYETTVHDGQGNLSYHSVTEWAYDDSGNQTAYRYVNTGEDRERNGYIWEREYDDNGNETAFCLYDETGAVFYRSGTEYHENGLPAGYKGYDADDNMIVCKETEYDAAGKVTRENEYDADGVLFRYYENVYDEFGNVTTQYLYENGIVRAERQIAYEYRYIGDIEPEAADLLHADAVSEEYRNRQREMLGSFLEGKEEVRCYADMIGGEENQGCRIVEETITDLVNFSSDIYGKKFPLYAFLDVTGDGCEELLIRCNPDKLYVIQYDHGILKIICEAVGGNGGAYLVKYGKKTGICCDFGGHVWGNGVEYYFPDGKGTETVLLGDYQIDPDNGEYGRSYNMADSSRFVKKEISAGEYYDIADRMIEIPDNNIDWHSLEERYD